MELLRRKSNYKDVFQLALFVVSVYIATVLINAFVFQSFNVEGKSMEQTLNNGDRLIVNRLPVTVSKMQHEPYSPARGQIIVFKNPHFQPGQADEYIVKRVIAFGGERVVLSDGHYTVYNTTRPDGFNPDDMDQEKPGSPTAGLIDVRVPNDTLFVSGDHRQINPVTKSPFSLDSRNGLGFIPLSNVVGPVALKIFPFQSARWF
jgi:signal peptidase I